MKLSSITVAVLVGSAAAFAPTATLVRPTTSLQASGNNNRESSRADFLSQFYWTVTASTTLLTIAPPAHAAKYGSFGAGSPNLLDPTEAIVDKDVLSTSAVQNALESVKSYSAAVKSIATALEQNPQADVGPYLRKNFDFSKLRTDLNVLNTAFDEDTQRGTDRLIRVILQDITELEIANKQKEGIERSERRLGIMKGKLAKLTTAFDDLLAFAK